MRPVGLVLWALIAIAVSAGAAASAAAKPSLRDQSEIDEGLTAIAVADMIRKNCDSIEPRMLRAYGFMRSLRSRANDLGYSDDEIRAYVKDKAEKKRVAAQARRYLKAQGVALDRPQSYCPAGHAEIERKSQAGVLLRAR
jgi:hypothetical protein